LGLLAQQNQQLELARTLFRAGKYPQCIAACDEQLKTHFEQSETYLLRAKANIELEEFPLAINDLNASIKRNKQNAEAFNLRGYCYFNSNDYRLARIDFIEACYLDDSSHASYFYNLANVEQHMHKNREAIKSYTKAIQMDQAYSAAYANRGHIYLKQMEYNLAMRDIDSALKYDQQNEELFLYRGMTLTALKRNKEALAMFNRCLRLKPDDHSAYYNKGRVYCQMKDYKKAVANFDTAISLKPSFEIAYFDRAVALLEIDPKQHKEAACNDFAKAIQLGFLDAAMYLKKYCE
jgi:tetratricopeptide (TPR) repeat protein